MATLAPSASSARRSKPIPYEGELGIWGFTELRQVMRMCEQTDSFYAARRALGLLHHIKTPLAGDCGPAWLML